MIFKFPLSIELAVNYLFYSKAELTPSLLFYSIHSNNPEIISFIESNNIPPSENYKQCLIELKINNF